MWGQAHWGPCGDRCLHPLGHWDDPKCPLWGSSHLCPPRHRDRLLLGQQAHYRHTQILSAALVGDKWSSGVIVSLPASPHQQAEGSSSPWGSGGTCCWGLRLVPAVAGSKQGSHSASRLPRCHPGLSHSHTYPSGREGIREKWDGWGTSGSHCSHNCSSSQGLLNRSYCPPRPGVSSPRELQCFFNTSLFRGLQRFFFDV